MKHIITCGTASDVYVWGSVERSPELHLNRKSKPDLSSDTSNEQLEENNKFIKMRWQ